mmetsp:Transcript_30154/g.74158  ORF Transcript_30154/g.74158 Transcript_30154/m.74158 type:complete len:421 (-) Transcript_30154:233-1495(-)|eukprot:CAMPEP_0206218418 /NCGR_PEP_ID=MMETSP0047_2-20121206/3790_1 /ASSEMBLY_ACC=CAM_ASM_000192 /TAXON_ID=195065 /ORGANISM="Chroomonas mesostigmatica_cf, Strain CCMP1168" /LENGTH=420 /DNA_ID=CAMNT_0053640923 /DNA_START=126 /DNA_END=1388 /DNA_ORIENTATION=+
MARPSSLSAVWAAAPALLLLCECAAFTSPWAATPRLGLQGAGTLRQGAPAHAHARPRTHAGWAMSMEWGRTTRGLEGQVCLVTGASRGIGKGIAIALGEQGATVWVTGRTRAALEQTAKLVDEAGGHGVPCVVDHADQRQIQRLFRRIREEDGRLNVLVNNCFAAVDGLFGEDRNLKFWERNLDWWDTVNNIGLKAHFVASQLAVPLMMGEAQVGNTALIVHVSSIGGMRFFIDTAYGVGKAAKDRMAADMAVELRDTAITVVSLWPGPVRTEKITSLLLNNTRSANASSTNTSASARTAASSTATLMRSGGSAALDSTMDVLMRRGFEKSGETPLFVGRAVAGLARDRARKRKAGRVLLTADLSDEYGFTDEYGVRPLSMRSVGKPVEFLSPQLAGMLPRGVKIPKLFLGVLGGNRFFD